MLLFCCHIVSAFLVGPDNFSMCHYYMAPHYLCVPGPVLVRSHHLMVRPLLCQAIADAVRAETAVPFLESANTMDDKHLFAQCRSFIAAHPAEVRRSGGVEQLRDLSVAKGLLADAMDEVAHLRTK